MNALSRFIFIGFLLLSGLVAAYGDVTKTTYYIPDASGSPVAAIDKDSGQVLWRKHYRPFGEEIEQDQASRDNRIGYTGHVHDRDTGLTYMGGRYYHPVIGRFISMDSVGVDPNNPASFNRYAYANNNPYKYIDPDGRWPLAVEAFRRDGDTSRASFFMGAAASGGVAAGAVLFSGGPVGVAADATGIPIVSKKELLKSVKYLSKNGADNIANASRLAKQLRLASAKSPFKKNGQLTDDAIKNSKEIIPSSEISNPAIPKGFSKYSTETFQSPSGSFQTHFYKNSSTGDVFYGQDYKVIFNSKSGG